MRTGKSQILIKNNSSELAFAGASLIVSAANESLGEKGKFAMAVSGGSTPRPMHRLLVKEPYLSGIPWRNTHIFWVDERCVPEEDPDSNYGAAKRDFLDLVPISSDQIHYMPGELPPDEGARRYVKEIIEFFQLKDNEFPIFDLVLLGMGADGHTASLFPGHRALEERERLVVSLRGGNPDVYRLTLTLPVINNAKKILFLVSGKEKSGILKEVFKEGPKILPAQRIQPVDGELIWLIDRQAASLL